MSTLRVNTLQNTSGVEVYTAKAWVNFNGTGTVAIRAAGNVSSITDNGTGDYTVNFTTALADANFSIVSTANNVLDGSGINTTVATYPLSSSAASVKTTAATTAGFFDAAWISVAIFR